MLRPAFGTPEADASIAHRAHTVAKRATVRGLVFHFEHFVDVLMRHLVLEHFDDRAPRMRKNERTRNLERARRAVPLSEARLGNRKRENGRTQRFFEIRRVHAPPLEDDLAYEHALELRRNVVTHGTRSSGG